MVRALRSENIDACILSSDDDVGNVLDVPHERWVEHQGVPCLFLPRVKARQHTLVGFTYTPRYPSWLRQHVREFDFLHVHTVFSHPANSAMRLARQLGVPACVRPLGQLCRWSMLQRAFVKRLQLALWTRRNVNGMKFIHCTSRMEADETGELGFKSPCKVLAHGMEMPPVVHGARESLRLELGLPSDRKLVVFMSRFHEKKGIELLIDAMAGMTDDFDVILAGTGDEAYVQSLKQRIASAHVDGRMHWLGFVQGGEKWRLLQGSDVFVLPSQSENFGIVVLEAMACGLPVVVSDQVALKDEVIEHKLGAVVSREVDALREGIRQMLRCDGEISERATGVARGEFSWSAAARRLIDAYRSSIAC